METAPRDRRPTSAFVISITPFDQDGRLDEAALRRHLARMAAAGIGVYVGGGGSGEGFTLSPAEARRVLEIGVEELAGKVSVRAMGTEPRTAQEMIDFVGMARSVGVDATQIYSLDQGHGHRPTAEEIEAYFSDILAQVELPAVLSTHQSVGYRIPVELLTHLVKSFDQVIGINCSVPDLGYLARIVDAVGDRVDIHVGGPYQTLTALALGAQGYLSSEANLAPRLCMSVLRHYEDGNLADMMGAFGQVVRLSDLLYGNGGIRVTKGVLNNLGLPGGQPRPPQLPSSPASVARVMEVIKRMDLADREEWATA